MHKFYLDYVGLNEKELIDAFKQNCAYGDLEKIKYLLNKIVFNEEIINHGFKIAFLKNNQDIISFVLDNYNISEKLVDSLIAENNAHRSTYFLMAKMYDKKLPFQDVKIRKIKI